jgi:hypothetical protein
MVWSSTVQWNSSTVHALATSFSPTASRTHRCKRGRSLHMGRWAIERHWEGGRNREGDRDERPLILLLSLPGNPCCTLHTDLPMHIATQIHTHKQTHANTQAHTSTPSCLMTAPLKHLMLCAVMARLSDEFLHDYPPTGAITWNFVVSFAMPNVLCPRN